MSVHATTEVWKHTRGMKAGAKLLMLALADHCNDEMVCWPLMDTIARKCDCDEKTASRTVKELESDGYLTVKRGGGRSKSNTYTLYPRGNAPQKTPQVMGDSLRGNEPKPPQTKGDKNAQTPANKGGLNCPSLKEEPSGSFDKVLTIRDDDEGVSRLSSSSSPQISIEKSDDILRTALCEVCVVGEQELLRIPKRERELKQVCQFLRGLGYGNDVAVATALRERFALGLWPFPIAPHLSQIETYWPKMGRALESRNQPTNEVNNGKNISNTAGATASSPRRYESAAERKGRKWDEWGAELGVGE